MRRRLNSDERGKMFGKSLEKRLGGWATATMTMTTSFLLKVYGNDIGKKKSKR